jgi:hypothetical protein
VITVFVPGKLRNPLNGSWGGWRKHARLAKEWRARTTGAVYLDDLMHSRRVRPDPTLPATITFTAHVGRRWDDDNIPGAVKPIRDGLVDARVIHSDGLSSGHTFRYAQVVDRERRGVEVQIDRGGAA